MSRALADLSLQLLQHVITRARFAYWISSRSNNRSVLLHIASSMKKQSAEWLTVRLGSKASPVHELKVAWQEPPTLGKK